MIRFDEEIVHMGLRRSYVLRLHGSDEKILVCSVKFRFLLGFPATHAQRLGAAVD